MLLLSFSCYGKVRHLAGQPVSSVAVEAVSEDCNQLQEEDTTTEEGTFRVRGLNPGCSYQLRLKSEPDIPGTIPSQFMIQVSNARSFTTLLCSRAHAVKICWFITLRNRCENLETFLYMYDANI